MQLRVIVLNSIDLYVEWMDILMITNVHLTVLALFSKVMVNVLLFLKDVNTALLFLCLFAVLTASLSVIFANLSAIIQNLFPLESVKRMRISMKEIVMFVPMLETQFVEQMDSTTRMNVSVDVRELAGNTHRASAQLRSLVLVAPGCLNLYAQREELLTTIFAIWSVLGMNLLKKDTVKQKKMISI